MTGSVVSLPLSLGVRQSPRKTATPTMIVRMAFSPSFFISGVTGFDGAVVFGMSGSGGGVVVVVGGASGSDDGGEDGGGFGFVWPGCAPPLGELIANVAVARPSPAIPATTATTASRPTHGRKRRLTRLDGRRSTPIAYPQPSNPRSLGCQRSAPSPRDCWLVVAAATCVASTAAAVADGAPTKVPGFVQTPLVGGVNDTSAVIVVRTAKAATVVVHDRAHGRRLLGVPRDTRLGDDRGEGDERRHPSQPDGRELLVRTRPARTTNEAGLVRYRSPPLP
jgi:hypothetical protein